MKFNSLQSLSPDLRTNAIFCLLFLVFFSLQSLITSVVLQPNEKTKFIWSTDTTYITCKPNPNQNAGYVKWFRNTGPHATPVPDAGSPVYTRDFGRSRKLMIINATKRNSGIYECRHIKDNNQIISADKFDLKVFNAIDLSETENKKGYEGVEGGSFSMPCFVRFDSDMTDTSITWTHNNHLIKEKGDPEFSVNNVANVVNHHGSEFKKIRSTLTIKNLSKDHEGSYLCQAEAGNEYLSDVKVTEIQLKVQFKPRFVDKNHKNVWISDDSDNDVLVNVTCMVNAEPQANFSWWTHDGLQISRPHQGRAVSKMPDYNIFETENISVLSLKYTSLNQIRKDVNDPHGKRKRFKCVANNTIGNAKQDFSINIGKLPEPPILNSTSYDNGYLWLNINETEVTPPIDMYRVDIDNDIPIYFNETNRADPLNKANSTYRVEVTVPKGVHHLNLFAHNPVGWSPSNNPIPPLRLVISGADIGQQYSALTALLASVLALRYAL